MKKADNFSKAWSFWLGIASAAVITLAELGPSTLAFLPEGLAGKVAIGLAVLVPIARAIKQELK